MIIAVVRFGLASAMTPEQGAVAFAAGAPGFQGVNGLQHKHFLLSEDGTVAGGVYQWESREQAEQMYTDAWRDRIAVKYGSAPTVEYFTSPVQVSPTTITVDGTSLEERSGTAADV
jgi:hypothetical protein